MCVHQRRNYAKFQVFETPSVDSTAYPLQVREKGEKSTVGEGGNPFADKIVGGCGGVGRAKTGRHVLGTAQRQAERGALVRSQFGGHVVEKERLRLSLEIQAPLGRVRPGVPAVAPAAGAYDSPERVEADVFLVAEDLDQIRVVKVGAGAHAELPDGGRVLFFARVVQMAKAPPLRTTEPAARVYQDKRGTAHRIEHAGVLAEVEHQAEAGGALVLGILQRLLQQLPTRVVKEDGL